MEINLKSRCIVIVFALLVLFTNIPTKAADLTLPKDMPTFEALMALHKQLKGDEDEAMTNIAVSLGEQTLVSKGAKAFNNVRTTLNTKLSNVHSYVILAAAISSTATGLYKVSQDYKDLTVNTYKKVLDKPFVAWYYTEANTAIAREIKHCEKLYAAMAASGLNVMKASMDEKLNLVFTLKNSIDRIQAIIYNANLFCSLITDGGWKPDYIWEILTSDVRDDLIKALVSAWYGNSNKNDE